MFPAVGPSKPGFARFAVDDYGYAIRFGDFETSAHARSTRSTPSIARGPTSDGSPRKRVLGLPCALPHLWQAFPKRLSRDLAEDHCAILRAGRPRSLTAERWRLSPRCSGSLTETIESYSKRSVRCAHCSHGLSQSLMPILGVAPISSMKRQAISLGAWPPSHFLTAFTETPRNCAKSIWLAFSNFRVDLTSFPYMPRVQGPR